MRNGTHVGSLLPERAPSEGPRSTGAVEPIMSAVPRGRNERAWKEHPIMGVVVRLEQSRINQITREEIDEQACAVSYAVIA